MIDNCGFIAINSGVILRKKSEPKLLYMVALAHFCISLKEQKNQLLFLFVAAVAVFTA